MPSGNQHSPQGQGPVQGAREQLQQYGQQIQEKAAHAGQRFREGYEMSREELARRYRRAEGMVARNPTPSVLVGFGIGFGLGLVLTTLLTRREETWTERYLPESVRNVPDAIRHTPETLQNLAESIASRVSSALRR